MFVIIIELIWLQRIKQQSMESTNRYLSVKNKRRLVTQNMKLLLQITKIQEQIDKHQEESLHDNTLLQSQMKPFIDEIASQEKVIKKLKFQIDRYHLERAKDNVEYIVREEDELKAMRRQELKLMDEKQIYINKKQDKNSYLQKDAPYQEYEKDFLQRLTEVVHFNREKASKITQIQRQIRKYHLIKKSKGGPIENSVSIDQVLTIEKQIEQKKQAKKKLQTQWKPHFEQQDTEFARLLHEVSLKKEQVAQLMREQKNWETRVSAIRDAEGVLNDKNRRGNVKVSSKLRQKILDYIEKEEQKIKKKVNQDELKYQFIDNSPKQDKVEDGANKNSPPPLPGQKKKQQKVFQLQHNDKNITKKVDKSPNTKKNTKTSQNSNTQVSIPPNADNKKVKKIMPERKSLQLEENQNPQVRKWAQNDEPVRVRESPKSTPKNSNNGVIRMQEMAVETVAQNWQDS